MIEKEYTAKTVDEAIAIGLEELKITADQAIIDIVEEKKGFFKKSATVKITVKSIKETSQKHEKCTDNCEKLVAKSYGATANNDADSTEERPARKLFENDQLVVDFLTELLAKMDLDCTLNIKANREVLTIIIGGKDVNYAIGYRGETLDNIQYLCLLAANKNIRYKKKLVIDAEGYREIRAEQLASLSKKLAFKVSKSNTAIELEPMNPFERRVIHTTLQDDKFVTTSSEGVEPNRYVVISPIKKEDTMYDMEASRKFKQEGIKTRSFGQKPKKF